jgi:hypothetical protein
VHLAEALLTIPVPSGELSKVNDGVNDVRIIMFGQLFCSLPWVMPRAYRKGDSTLWANIHREGFDWTSEKCDNDVSATGSANSWRT